MEFQKYGDEEKKEVITKLIKNDKELEAIFANIANHCEESSQRISGFVQFGQEFNKQWWMHF